MDFDSDQSLKEWAKDKPLSILQLDPADRAVLRIADERDAIQKKTFTKWVNKHLKKASRHVNDLFLDLQDGLNLISLLEVLSGELLPRERGRMRFHMLQNVQMALDFLRHKKIKLVNIRAEDIVDGNPKLTLGLIWTIILHFQISDIVVGEEPNVTAREALLKWARRSTSKYPGVRVSDFTTSWRDGLAFNAIIHRNRPDLIDWRSIRSHTVRERLETAFYTAEKEYGVTRLLDPEDVDTHEIDEKSIITYISSMYDVFPEPPATHPLYDSESQQKTAEYRDLASSLHLWIREKLSAISDRNFPTTLIEMKKLATESTRFRNEEVPAKHRDKQRLQHVFRELQKYFEAVGEVDLDPELHIDVIDRNWNKLMMTHQEREHIIHEEIKRLEKLQRLAEKVHREMKRVDTRLEDTESKINEEARRLERLHPLDAKYNVDLLEQELRTIEENIQSLFTDVQVLRDGKYPQSSDLQKRVEKLHQRWVNLRSLLHSRLIAPLASMSFPVVEERVVTRHTSTVLETRLVDTNPHFRNLQECIEWCSKKLKQLQEAEYGSDLPGVQAELTSHLREHKAIEQFQSRAEQCINAKNNFHGEELTLYMQYLNTLQKLYTELLTTSNKRLSDLETLQDFLQSAHNQLVWLNEKEEIELTRDWSDRDLNIPSVQQYYESLMSELEKREIQFSAVQDRGESLLLQHHPAYKCIEAYMAAMNSQWSWILQLTLCLETHLKHSAYYQQFYKDIKEAETWLNKRDELLNTVYSQSDFTLDEGESLLKGMQELREELNQYGEVVATLGERAQNVVPLKQRRQPITRPMPILAICNYKQGSVNIEKGEQWVLHDNSGRIKWRVSSGASGSDSNIPGVVFLIPPPDKEALEAVDRLKRQFDRSIALWQRKQLRMRQNMIFSTIKVVRSWDLAQFLAMGDDQRNAIRKALNEDAAKLLEEGDPTDPQLRRLRREMDEVNKLFDEFERRARLEEESKNATRIFNDQASALQASLDELEHTLNTRLNSPIPKDIDSLEHLVIQHKDFETRLKGLTEDVETIQETFRNIAKKTPTLQNKLDKILKQWDSLWNYSRLYIERLKCIEIVLNGLNETSHILSDFEIKLAAFGEMPSDLEALRTVRKELLAIQSKVKHQEPLIEQLMQDGADARRLVENTRHHIHRGGPHHDLDRLDVALNKVQSRWNNICSQLVDRLRSCEAAYDLLDKYKNSYQNEVDIMEEFVDAMNKYELKAQPVEQIDTTKNLFKTAMERVNPIEQVNVVGGRFIREAKIYDVRLHHYCDWLIDKVHPGLEPSAYGKHIRMDDMSGNGEAAVSHELDVLNNKFEAILNVLYDRLKQLVVIYPENAELRAFVENMQPQPLRTFRTEFSIYEQTLCTETFTSTTKRIINGVIPDVVDSSNSSQQKEYINCANYNPELSSIMGNKMSSVNGKRKSGSMYFSEIRSHKNIHKVEENIEPNMLDGTEMRGIIHPETGVILTVEEAIRLRILDVRTGKIATSLNSKSSYITIENAVQCGLVTPELAEKLLGPCIIQDNGSSQLSLLEAIQRELIDAERGPLERLKVSDSNERGLSIAEAVTKNVLDIETGQVVDSDQGVELSLEEAFSRGIISSCEVTDKRIRLSLFDLINHRLVKTDNGLIFDRDTGNLYNIKTAILKNIVNPDIKEIVDASRDIKVTLREALNLEIIKNQSYIHGLSGECLSLHEAKRRQLIIKPLSLKDCVELDILEDDGLFKSPTYRSKFTLLESIAAGVLDSDSLKTVMDKQSKQLLTLSEALGSGIILPNSTYVDKQLKLMIPVSKAVEQGLIYSQSIISVFDIAGFKKPKNNDYIGLNAALVEGVIKNGTPITYVCNEDRLLIPTAIEKGFVKSELFEMLSKKIDICGSEQTVFTAAVNGYINPQSGLIVDPESKLDIPFNKAIEQKLITLESLAVLKSLLAITLSTQTVTKIVIKYATTVQFTENDQKFEDISVPSNDSKQVDTCKYTTQVVSPVGNYEVDDSQIDPSCKKKKSPIKEKIIKMLEPLKMKQSSKGLDEKPVVECIGKNSINKPSETKKQVVELPPEGWSLEDAISAGLFDPVNGVFIIPGTDRLVSFEECIKLQIIDPKSALVVDVNKPRTISMEKSLEKRIINSVGNYCSKDGTNITMKEAIEKSLVLFNSNAKTDINNPRLIQITKITGHPDLIQVSDGSIDEPEFTEVAHSKELAMSPMIINPNCIFDPATALVLYRSDNKRENILTAIDNGNIEPTFLMVKDPHTNAEITFSEAIAKNIINTDTKSYVGRDGLQITLVDAIRGGFIIILGTAPNIEPDTPPLPSFSIKQPKDGVTIAEIPIPISYCDECHPPYVKPALNITTDNDELSPAEVTRNRVTTEPKYLVSIGKAKSIPPLLKQGKPVILQRMKKRRLRPDEALISGVIDKETADLLGKINIPSDEQIPLHDVLIASGIDPSAGEIVDPQNGDLISIKEAADRGVLDISEQKVNILMPVARSLSLPDLLKQGLYENGTVIHPITGDNLTLDKALVCEIVNSSSKIFDSSSENILTIGDAFEKGILTNNLAIKWKDCKISIHEAVEKENIFISNDPESELRASNLLPLMGMTLSVASNKGIYDPSKNEITHPLTHKRSSIDEAIKEGFIISVPFTVEEITVKLDIPEESSIEITECEISSSATNLQDPTDSHFKEAESFIENIYDEKSGKFKNPKKSFRDLLDKNIVSPDIMIRDNKSGISYSLKEATEKGLIDPVSGTVKDPKSGLAIPIKKAVKIGLIGIIGLPILAGKAISDAFESVNSLGNDSSRETECKNEEMVCTPEINEIFCPLQRNNKQPDRIVITKHLTSKDLSLRGIYDLKNQKFLDPLTGEITSFENAILLSDMFNIDDINVKYDDTFVPITEALVLGVLDLEDGFMKDPYTGREVSFFEAIKLGWICETSSPSAWVKQIRLPLEEAIKAYIFDKKTCLIKNPNTNEYIKFNTALINGIIIPESVTIRDPANGNLLSLMDAIDSGIINLNLDVLYNAKTNEEYDFSGAFRKGYIFTNPRIPMSLVAASNCGIYDTKKNKIRDNLTDSLISLDESIKRSIIDPRLTKCKDTRQNQFMLLDKAIEHNLLDDYYLHDTANNSWMPIYLAICEKLIKNVDFRITLIEGVVQHYYNPKDRRIFNPLKGTYQTVKESVDSKFIDYLPLRVKDVMHDTIISAKDAVASGIINLDEGLFINPVELTLDVAIEKNFILPPELSFESELLSEAEFKTHPTNGNEIIDEHKTVINGIVHIGKKPEEGSPEATNGDVSSDNIEAMPVKPRRRSKNKLAPILFDPSCVIVKLDDKVYSYEHAVEEGIVDLKNSAIRFGDNKVTFQDALQLGLIIEVRRPISLREAVNNGIFNRNTGLYLDPATGKYLTLQESIDQNLIDPFSVRIVNTRSGDNLSLIESIRLGIINGKTSQVADFNDTENYLTLLDAFNSGIIVDNLSIFSIQKALQKKLYDPKTGKLTDLNNGQKVTIKEAMCRRLLNPDSLCYWDDIVKQPLNLTKTCDCGLIDDKLGLFKIPNGNKLINLIEANDQGYILKLTNFNLCEAIEMILHSEGLFIDPETGAKLCLKDALKYGLIVRNKCFVKDKKNDVYFKLSEAINRGLIDSIKNVYNIPESKHSLTLKEAYESKLIILAPIPQEVQTGSVYNESITSSHLENLDEPIRSHLEDLNEAPLEFIRDTENSNLIGFPEEIKTLVSIKYDQPKNNRDYTLRDAINLQIIDPIVAVIKTFTDGSFQPLNVLIENREIDLNGKITFPQPTGNVIPQCAIFDNTTIIFFKKPLSLSKAIQEGHLNLENGKFSDPNLKQILSLKDAINYGYIDVDSALVKDYGKRRLLKIPDAFAKGIIDFERNTVLDGKSSRLFTLSEALTAKLITTKGLTLIEALDFGLYNPVTGIFYDPYFNSTDALKKRKFALENAVQSGLIDPSSAQFRDTLRGNILTYEDAVTKDIIDPINGRIVDTDKGTTIDLVKAKNAGIIILSDIRQAMEEKYKLCDDTLSGLLSWIGEIEDRLANQDVAQEDINQLRNQINILKLLKEEIDSQSRPVTSCLDQVRHVVATGSEYLSRDEINNLEKKGKSLRTRYDRVNERTDKLLRRLLAASEELTKFRNDLGVFVNWMERSKKILEEKERSLSNLNRIDGSVDSTREFVSDVIAHQADLRFITMAAQKFVDESKEYLTYLNEFRTSLPQRLPHIEPVSSHDSAIRNTVTTVTNDYRDLLTRVNALSDKLSGLGNKQKEYRDALSAAKAWLRDAEPRANKVLMEPIAADPNALEDQLSRSKTLNNEFVAQGRLIDNAKQALDSLLRSLDGQISTTEANNLKAPVTDLNNKYKQLCDALAEKCQILDTALVQSQGVQDALDGLLSWLNDAENTLKNLTRPASLHKERLEDQMREHKVLQSDIDSHRASVDSVAQSTHEIITTASNPRLAKKLESKLRDVTSRFEKLLDKMAKRGELLFDIHTRLTSFNEQASTLERWLNDALEILPEATGNRIDELVAQRDSQRQALDQTVRDGKALINNKDVTDIAIVRDRVKALESQWKELNHILDEKQRVTKLRSEQLLAYEKLRDQVIIWLNNMDKRVNNLEPVAVEMEILKKQIDELKPLVKEHRDYSSTIDKVNDFGSVYDSLSRPDTPTRRRSAASPTKRNTLSVSSMRRGSQDSTPSPSRGLGYLSQSPLSASGSSGFGSRRSSQDGLLLEELTHVQEELSEINNRYSLLGVRLNDRQLELDNIRDELRKHLDHLKTLAQFLDKIQRLLPKESVPQSKEEADKAVKQIKGILEEIYEKQALLESTRAGVNDLLRRKPTALGADILHDDLQDVMTRWKQLNDSCKNRIQMLEDLKDFHDAHDNLSGWLNAKDKMMTVLGPISSDSRMVQSQVQQVQVLREEFRTQQPQLNHLLNIGESILTRVPDRKSPDGQKIANKLSNIQKRWNDLLSRLDDRADSLGAAADTSREFYAGLVRLRDALQNISDQLDDIPLDKEPEEQLRKIQSLERQLEGQRPLLADLEAAGAQLCDVLSDPTSRAEIQSKLSAINRQYNNLQKKLDHRKAEIEGSLRDGRQFEASCAKTLGWLSDLNTGLSERLLISADRDILQQQVEHHEPIYKDVIHREHEVIMLLNKGRDLLARSSQQNRTDTRTLQRDIDKIQQHWDKLRKDTVERQTRLQTCMEHCRKYYKALETFIPWLSQAENKLDALRPDSFKRKDVEKQLRELSAFRNDVWKHSGEFENMRTLGETFLSACDVDKDIVKQELAAVKARWDKLNNELFERTQWLEDTARRLADFSENMRDLGHSVQRCEDKLASHDALGGAARDSKMLERIKAVREEVGNLRKPLLSLRQSAKDLISEAAELGVGNASHLMDDVDGLNERLDDLQAKLDDRCSQLQSASTALAQYNERVKGLAFNLSELEQELDSMKPPARDIKTVRNQIDDVTKLIKKILKTSDEINGAIEAGERLVDSGFAPDTATTREQTENLTRQLNKLDERSRNRQTDLEHILDKLQDFQQSHTSVMDDIAHTSEEFRRLKPVGSEVETIKSQQEEFDNFRKMMIDPLSHLVDDVNKLGQGLIQSAAGGVNTSGLEKDLEKLNDRWNTLKGKLNERDRKLDVGLLQSGKFQEALDGLAKWLTDTEEMVANQKPPSADYKVVKAQLQEQKFLNKMLADRQNSMSSLFSMGNEVAAGADANERKAIERQMHDLMRRFDKLCEGAAQRMDALEQAMIVAKQFQDKLVPILEWLDGTEKRVKDMEMIPTDEEKIQQRIREHDALHKDILRKKPALTELTDVASALMALVGDDEASGVADKLQDTADRYTTLVDASDNIGQLLQASKAGLRHLVLTYQDLQAWMENVENQLNKYKILPVHTEKLLRQMEDLADVCEEISNRQNDVDGTVDSGLELMKHISNDEAIQLKDKLDSLQRRYNDLTSRGADLLKHAQEALPLVQQFYNSHGRLVDWLMEAESQLQVAEPKEDDITRLELDIQEFRPILENINLIGPQLCQISPGEGAATIEGLVTRDNRRFDAIVEQIQRKAERIHLSKQRALEVIGDIDELLDWFREVENQLTDAEPPSSEPDVIRLQLKEHKALNDDISSQKGRVRDVLSTAKKVLRETAHSEDTATVREKMEDLKETMDTVSKLGADRLSILEQALPLSEHFHQSHIDLGGWLEDMERQVAMLAMPAMRPDLIAQQQDRNEMFVQSILEHKPLVDKLNKTGEALMRLCNSEEGAKVQDILDSDNARYSALRLELRQRQQALEKALQETSQFSDKLEGMLRALANTADQVSNAEPISVHPPRIRDQIDENSALVEDLDKREEAFQAVKKAANDVINKAPNASDPAVKDIKRKLEKLNHLWNDVQKATTDRARSLEEALALAEKFWDELQSVMATLRDLQDSLISQEPPAVQPAILQQQQEALQEIKAEIDQTKPEIEQCRASGHKLMKICGEPEKPEVKKHIEDLDNAWDNITALFAKREENLINAMEKAMEFHETLQDILDFLEKAEIRFAKLGPLGSDIDAVKHQIAQLKQFKSDVDPHMVKVEALNRQAQELTERTSAEQAAALKEPLASVNRRWDDLLRGVVERQRQLEHALLRLGQFHHALAELLTWIDVTNKTLDHELKPVAGDPQLLEIELAKLKVLVNDIQAHQSSVDTLNDAGRQLIESGKGTDEASATQDKLSILNKRWRDLLQKAADRQLELEEALRDAQRFSAEIQDLLSWLGEVDGVIAASKPVGGLPETASEQLERFMEVFAELEENRPKVETVLTQGQEYLKKSPGTANNLQHNLKTLKQRWDSVTARANDKKIKLEIALKEATEFHEALQSFVDWLTKAEKTLSSLKPVSRVLSTILVQIEEHKSFQKDVSAHREAMLHLDKKGTHLKYFSQKQDVILIKNLLISVQHRWERVVAKSAERTRALDHGYKEAREFDDAWSGLMNWLSETEKSLDGLSVDASSVGNDPFKIKQRLTKHHEFQRALSTKQPVYDNTMRMGKALKEKAPKFDESHIKQMLAELKDKWNTVCSKTVDRQRKLEEALLYCGQFKDALDALLDWLKKAEKQLHDDGPVHGDLDTVTALLEQHRAFEDDLENRATQLDSVKHTAEDLILKANDEDANTIKSKLKEIDELWEKTVNLSERKSRRLAEALKQAEQLHKSVNMLLEWLSDAEMKLRFIGALPDDEQETRNQLMEHEKFMREMLEKENEKDATISLAKKILEKAHPDAVSVIKHWITIIQSRWDEVSTWAKQREQRLRDHLRSLQDLDTLLEELLAWLFSLENTLLALEAEQLPDDIPTVERLLTEHKEFMENIAQRQTDVDTVCKAKQIPLSADQRKQMGKKSIPVSKEDSLYGSVADLTESQRKSSLKSSRDNLLDKRTSRGSPGLRDRTDSLPHIGPRFPPKGSKGSEPVFRNSRCKQLWDKWRNVWLLAWERQRRLQERLDYLKEVEKVRNFSWDDWRKRFLRFMNHKKSRLTDLFRKMDKNNDGLIPREDFINGIMNTKFDTSKLEMNAVADMFDHDKLGLIDWKEFIAALRPDWEEKKPVEAEQIHDEVKRLVMLCTCRQKFRVFQVGEGKYRFGDSQKLRLVRILRSTVMVRVGGGWVALDEFLVKNDPCRVEMLPMPNPFVPEEHEPWCEYGVIQIYTKGRTNIELREQFILADGVSQSMSAFKPKHNTSGNQRPSTLQTNTGPITKIRERTNRSVPLGKTGVNRAIGTPDSLSDNESSPYGIHTPMRKTATPTSIKGSHGGSLPASRGNSRPQSRQNSKPPSRHGSNLSLDSTDDCTPSRIPRRAPSRSGSTASNSRKVTPPAVNGSLSRGRSPSGIASPVSDKSGSMHRTSSIPTLSGVGMISGSRIPVYIGASPTDTSQQLSISSSCSSSSGRTSSLPTPPPSTHIPQLIRTRTPSGSSTPIPGSYLSRKSSGASDIHSRKGTKTPTPTDTRAPFRL